MTLRLDSPHSPLNTLLLPHYMVTTIKPMQEGICPCSSLYSGLFMIWPMTAIFDRLTKWLRQLEGADEQITFQQ